MALVVKKPPANAGDIRDMGLIPGLERFSGEGHIILYYYCLENPKEPRGLWSIGSRRVGHDWTDLAHMYPYL